MRRLPTGSIVLDTYDIICFSFSAGSLIAYGFKRYRYYRSVKIRGEDPLIAELKKKAPILLFSKKGKPLRLPLLRGGEEIPPYLISIVLKNKLFAKIMRIIMTGKKDNLVACRCFFFVLNVLLTKNGFHITSGGSLDYTQIILIVFPSTIAGFLIGTITQYPLVTALLPMALVFGRGIEDVPDPEKHCLDLCKFSAEASNTRLKVEMKAPTSNLEDAAAALQLPIDQVPLVCVQERRSLSEVHKMRQVLKGEKARKQVTYYRDFIRDKFPECVTDSEKVYQEAIRIRN